MPQRRAVVAGPGGSGAVTADDESMTAGRGQDRGRGGEKLDEQTRLGLDPPRTDRGAIDDGRRRHVA